MSGPRCTLFKRLLGALFCAALAATWPAEGAAAGLLKPHLHKADAYSEVYSLVLELEDGGHAQIELAVSNIGIGDNNAMCRAFVVNGRRSWKFASIIKPKDWRYTAPDNLRIGRCSIDYRAGVLRVVGRGRGGTLTATVKTKLSSRSFPGHRIVTKGGFFDAERLLHNAVANVSMSPSKAGVGVTQAQATMHRFWVTAPPSELASRWVRVFGLGKTSTLIVHARELPGRKGARGAISASPNHRFVALKGLKLRRVGTRRILTIGVGKSRYHVRLGKRLFRHAPLEDAGVIGRIIRMFVGNPVTETFRATLLGRDKHPELAALPERLIVELSTN